MFDVISAPRSAPSAASTSSINETLDEGTRASLDYQILRRTLLPDEVEAEAPASAADPPLASHPLSRLRPVTLRCWPLSSRWN